ncbi:accessory Sec system glycosylation chaperone GtfB [Streptococcus sp. zg-JUN1979]|uniref:accessory Sec system glycosylation chaperone GtfB n=1 Tax=Streptococcus sp. zg-JUN1979 TaxID=3391450 RepID=UPI0039A56103
MIRLYDYFTKESQDLEFSLEAAGYKGECIVINEDGFLPKQLTSPYAYFCGFADSQEGRPLYFNELVVPDFWQIAGNNNQAEVFDYNQQKARIFYAEPKHLRLIKTVDWLEANGKTRFSDHYNQYGWRFARTHFTAHQEPTVRTYTNQAGQEIIVENFKTGDIILNWQGKVHFFKNRVAFLAFYCQYRGLDTSEIWFNSLSTPFFFSRYLGEKGSDILFWQEDIRQEIPGNMMSIFNHPNDRVKRIIVQKKEAYQRLLTLLPETLHSRVSYLGYHYADKGLPQKSHDILIMTNSDQIEGLEELVCGLRGYRFHIGALTEMSERLTSFDAYDNVTLYPNISQKTADRLFEECAIYLDINHGNTILDSIRQAFEHNQLILAYDTTVHQPEFLLGEHVFRRDRTADLIQTIKASVDRKALIQKQRSGTIDESIEDYHRLLG